MEQFRQQAGVGVAKLSEELQAHSGEAEANLVRERLEAYQCSPLSGRQQSDEIRISFSIVFDNICILEYRQNKVHSMTLTLWYFLPSKFRRRGLRAAVHPDRRLNFFSQSFSIVHVDVERRRTRNAHVRMCV